MANEVLKHLLGESFSDFRFSLRALETLINFLDRLALWRTSYFLSSIVDGNRIALEMKSALQKSILLYLLC
jgi:hypothetical protein